ncbi:MAG TPA: Gfo/Idh/MocA family oxidoreductase [Tepidisphaeraceae bacterium]|nr:Gfo/Idh/MocA family oxidoreductase [Tepidisphaeraceae bacterium]
MSEAKTFRCALLGAGMAGDHHVRALGKTTNAKLVAVCDVDKTRAQASLDKNKATAPIYPDLKTLLSAQEIDVLHIATPSAYHADAAMMAFEKKINVISEKPLDITLERVDSMIAAAKKSGVRLAGIFQNRWNPANRAVKTALEQGRFGSLTWAGAFVLWYREPKYYQSWRGTKDIDGGGAIMNNSIHSIDLLQWLVGGVKSVSAISARRLHQQLEVEDSLSATLQFQNGALGTVVGTTAMHPGKPARIEIGGAGGSAVVEGAIKEFKFKELRPEDEQLLQPQPPTDFHLGNLQHIFDSWAAGKDAEVDGAECRKAVRIVLAMYESAAGGGRPVQVS